MVWQGSAQGQKRRADVSHCQEVTQVVIRDCGIRSISDVPFIGEVKKIQIKVQHVNQGFLPERRFGMTVKGRY